MKKILMLPSWYPSKDDPMPGSFFREQAEALSQTHEIVVLLVSIIEESILRYLSPKKRKMRISFQVDKRTENMKEVSLTIRVPRIYHRLLRLAKSLIGDSGSMVKKSKEAAIARAFLYYLHEESFSPDLIYAMTAQIIGPLARKLALKIGRPYILAEHLPFPLPGTLISEEIKVSLEESSEVLVPSNHVARMILMQNINCHPIVVPNMVSEEVARQKTIEENGVFTIVTVAAYNFYKDYETFLNYLDYLSSITAKEFRVIAIGVMPTPALSIYNKGIEEFNKLLSQHVCKDRLRVVEMVGRKELFNLLKGADLFVSTSIQETFGVACAEALSCGIPVFATRSGGVEDFIDITNGKVFPIGAWKELAVETKRLMDGEVLYEAAVIRCEALQRFGVEVFLKNMTTVFEAYGAK